MTDPSRKTRIADLCNPQPETSRGHQNQSSQSSSSQSTHRYTGESSSVHRHYSSFHNQFDSSRSRHPQNSSVRLPSIHEVLASTNIELPHPSVEHHSVAPTAQSASDSERKSSTTRTAHQCDRCGRVFTRRADLLKHIRVVHDRVKNFACEICGRRFGRKDYLTVSSYFWYLLSWLLIFIWYRNYVLIILSHPCLRNWKKKHMKALHERPSAGGSSSTQQ